MTKKEYRAIWAERGDCINCGSRKAVNGRKTCQLCLDAKKLLTPRQKAHKAEKQRGYILTARAAGMCTHCRVAPAILGQTKCQRCANENKAAHIKKREFVYTTYGGKCSCPPCGEARWQFLVLDHVNDDGNKHRKEVSDLVKWAFKNGCPPTLRLLCANCNTGRERNNGTCPHLTEVIIH